MNVKGMRILVTGASSGLGRHFSAALADAGATAFIMKGLAPPGG